MINSWERADLLTLLCFCHFPKWCFRSGMVLDCIDSDLCLPLYFVIRETSFYLLADVVEAFKMSHFLL